MNPEQLLQHFDRISEAPDAIPRLRRFILNLAVRGKLVEQDPNDEPAVELLKRIQLEKIRLVKDGQLKKAEIQKISTSTNGSPFGLPMSWRWVSLGEIAKYGIPDKVNSNSDVSHDTWILDLEDIEKDTSRLIERVISDNRPFRSTKTIFKYGDVLFGKLRPYLNKVLVADMDGVCTTEIIPIRGYCDMASQYVALVMRSPMTMATIDRLMYGMKMPRLGTNDGVELNFPLPPVAEQHRIVAKVDELMAMCDQLQAAQTEREQGRDRLVAASLHSLNPSAAEADNTPEAQREHARFIFNHLPRLTTRPAHIKQLRQTILNLAVRGKLVHQDPNDEPAKKIIDNIALMNGKSTGRTGKIKQVGHQISHEDAPFEIAYGWHWTRIGDICDLISGKGFKAEEYLDSGMKLFQIANVSFGVTKWETLNYLPINYCESYPELVLSAGDLLIALNRPLLNRQIKAAILSNTDLPSILYQRVGKFIFYSKSILPEYFLRYLQSLLFIEQLEANMQGSDQPFINKTHLVQFLFPVPPLAEQHRIVAKVDELMSLCDQLETQLTSTAADSRRLLEAVLHEALLPITEQAA